MSLSQEIRAVLSAGPKTIDQIAELVSKPPKKIQKLMYQLKFLGKVKYIVDTDNRSVYSIAKWPEKADKDAPPPRPASAAREVRAARAAEIPAQPPVPNGNGSAEEFAI